MSPLQLELKKQTLVMRLPETWPVLSWAPFYGGQVQSSYIFNHQNGCFEDNELESIFMNVVDTLGLPSNSVGMITGAEVAQFKQAWLNHGPLWVHVVATVGLGNTRAAGDRRMLKQKTKGKPPEPSIWCWPAMPCRT